MFREDFVSNSSSCSFVIGFKDEKTMENYRDTLKEEWGGKMADLIDNFFENNVTTPPEYHKEFAKRFKLFYYGIYQSTEDQFEDIAAGMLIHDQCPLDDDIDEYEP